MEQIGRYFEEFEKGQTIKHTLTKTIFESDNNLFSLLTMDHHPVHLNQDYAEQNQHGKIMVVGTLVFRLAEGITVPEIRGKAISNIGYEKIEHNATVFIGDTIYDKTKVLGTRVSRTKPDRGIIYVETKVTNQHNELVLTFRRHVLVKRKVN